MVADRREMARDSLGVQAVMFKAKWRGDGMEETGLVVHRTPPYHAAEMSYKTKQTRDVLL
jgi:hypothetical protein